MTFKFNVDFDVQLAVHYETWCLVERNQSGELLNLMEPHSSTVNFRIRNSRSLIFFGRSGSTAPPPAHKAIEEWDRGDGSPIPIYCFLLYKLNKIYASGAG